jgi:predicted alpha/beta-fold hydrolase
MKNTLWIVGLNLVLLFSTVTAVAQTNITQVKITPVKRDKSSSDFITAFGKNLIRNTGLMMLERANYPDGVQKSATKKECQPFMFENELINSESPQVFSQKVKQLFAKCESTWRNLNTPGLLGLLEFSNAEYDFSKNEKINSIEFQFGNGFHLKGYIAVQDEQVKRPWVIIKCGVFCAATESGSMRNFMMNLFDESPFNIIILGNRTGDDFIKENQTISVGGLYESADFYAVADWLTQDERLGKTVSSIHVLGISLGGSASVMAEHYHDLYERQDSKARIASYIAICPVVNLEPTIHDMYAPGIKGELFSRMTWNQLMSTKNYLPDASDLLNRNRMPSGEAFVDLFAEFGYRYGRKMQSNPLYFGKHPFVQSIQDYWSLSNYNEQTKIIRKPLFVWASKDDMIVSNKINTLSLENSELGNSENLALVNVNYGNHCGFSTAYGHSVTSSILRSFILNQSKDYQKENKYKAQAFSIPKKILGYGETHLRQIWFTKVNDGFSYLRFEIFNQNGESCFASQAEEAPANCRKVKTYKVKLKDLPVHVSPPKTIEQTYMLNRYLNTHLKLFNDDVPLELSEFEPNKITWKLYN